MNCFCLITLVLVYLCLGNKNSSASNVSSSDSQGRNNTALHRLFKDLLSDYNVLVRPVRNTSQVTDVTVNLNLLSIEELDETKQELVTTGWFHLVWRDEFLVWEKEKYDNIETIQIPPGKIWLPDLMILNAMDKYGSLGGRDLQIMVSNDGSISWFIGDRRRTSCKVVVTRFPLDHQTCTITVVQWTSTIKEVNYIPAANSMTFYSFEENGEWNISGYDVIEEYSFGGVYKRMYFKYKLDRRRAYYVISAILPVCILSLLNLFVFRVPPESGEKLTLCVSVLLSFAVYLTSINESLPEVSDHIAIFSVYLNIMFFLKALSVMATVWVLYLFNTPLPPGLSRRFFFWILRVSDHPAPSLGNDNTESLSLNSNDICSGKTDRTYNDVTMTTDCLHDNEWKNLVKRLDVVLFYLFLVFFLISTIGVFAIIHMI